MILQPTLKCCVIIIPLPPSSIQPSRPNGWTDRVQIFFKRRVLTSARVHAISIFDQIDSFRSAIENDRFLADFSLWSDIAAERFDLAGCFLVELLILTSSTRKSDPDPDRIIGSRDIAFSVFLEYLRNGRTGDIKLFLDDGEICPLSNVGRTGPIG